MASRPTRANTLLGSSAKRHLILCLVRVASSLVIYNIINQNGFVTTSRDLPAEESRGAFVTSFVAIPA